MGVPFGFPPHLTVPHRVDGVEQTIEMAYSEVQWSWARLTSLENDEDLRRQRAQRIPLGGYPTFPLTEESEGGARVENIGTAPNLYWLKLYRDTNIAVTYLHDPLGVAETLADAHEGAWAEMEAFIESLQTGVPPEFAAKIARMGDFAPKPTAEELELRREIAAQFEVTALMQQFGFASEENRKKYGRHLNTECLETLLEAKERRDLRRKIIETRRALVACIESDGYQAALEDYLENTPERRLTGKGVVLYSARFLEYPSTAMDAALDPPDVHTDEEKETAQAYMDKLRTASNSAGALLAQTVAISAEPRFRPSADPKTVALLQDDGAPPSLRFKTILEDQGVDLATKAGAVGAALIDAFAGMKADLLTLEWVSERINTLKVPGFGEYTLIDVALPEPKIPEGYHAVEGGRAGSTRPGVTYKAALALGAQGVTANGMMSVVQKSRVAIFPATIEVTEVTTRQLVRKDLKPFPARFAARYHNSIPRAVAVAPFFVALDLLNLRTALHQIVAGEIKGLGDGLLRGLQLTSAVGGVAQGMAETGNLWLRLGKMEESRRLAKISLRGRFLGNVAMGVFNAFDARRNYIDNDKDAAAAKIIAAGAFFGLAAASTWVWAIPLTVIAVGATLAGIWLEDDPVERFAKNGPLSHPPHEGATIWEKIHAHAQKPSVEAAFSAEWPHWTEIERLIMDEYLLGFALSSNMRGQSSRSLPPVYLRALTATCDLQRFVPMLSQAELFCHYYPGGTFSPTPTVIHPTVENFRTDEDAQMISRIDVSFPIPQEHLRNQSPYWSAIIFCRIKPQADRENCRPALGQGGGVRYLAIRHHGNGAIRKTTRRIGTMQELTSPGFWRVT